SGPESQWLRRSPPSGGPTAASTAEARDSVRSVHRDRWLRHWSSRNREQECRWSAEARSIASRRTEPPHSDRLRRRAEKSPPGFFVSRASPPQRAPARKEQLRLRP